jgi:GNAT superfamily N-acetyltransferase
LREAPYAFGSTHDREVSFSEQDWQSRIQRTALFVAFDLDEPLGLAGAFTPADRPDTREVVSMWVQPDHRGGKLADGLMHTVLDWARQDAAVEVTLWVADGNERARRFYLRYGFQPTGKQQPLWAQPGVGADEYVLALA